MKHYFLFVFFDIIFITNIPCSTTIGPRSRISVCSRLYAEIVNRDKKALGHIAEAFGIINVPTIIVMKDGKELGRVVEYGKTGKWDNELAEIVNAN